MENNLFVPIQRRKLILQGSLFFGIGLVLFLLIYYLGKSQDFASETVFNLFAVLMFLFFLIIAGTYWKNMKNKEAGVELSKQGIDDQSSSISVGLVKWQNVIGVEQVKSVTANYLVIKLKNPNKIIENAPNKAVERLLLQNMRIYQTPLVINVSTLDSDFKTFEGNVLD